MKKNKIIFGFTLAESMIMLVIIGVVASLVLWGMMGNHQKRETESKVRKVYSVLSQTTYKARFEYGAIGDWEVLDGKNTKAAKHFAETYLIPYLNVMKKCDNNNTKDCQFNRVCLNKNKYTHDVTNGSKAYRFYLADGTLISLVAYNNHTTTGHNKLVTIAFDINGLRPPNRLGRDVFIIEYMIETFKYPHFNGQMIPQYGNQTKSNLKANKSNMCHKKQTGEACMALIQKEGWRVTDTYPW